MVRQVRLWPDQYLWHTWVEVRYFFKGKMHEVPNLGYMITNDNSVKTSWTIIFSFHPMLSALVFDSSDPVRPRPTKILKFPHLTTVTSHRAQQIEIFQRLAWRRNYQHSDLNFFCTEADKNTTKLFGERHSIVCRVGCTGVIGTVDVYCTDFSVQENWFSGTRKYTHNLGETVTGFEAS